MPICDYKKRAEQSEAKVFSNPKISLANKTYLKKFLVSYHVSHARKHIFLTHIHQLLTKTDDLNSEMHDKDKINNLFYELRNGSSPSHYSTIVNISKRFVRWLNNGNLPVGFSDVKELERKKCLRKLDPEDMVTWDDALKMINHTNSVQFKAIIAIQLDGGFRPSEFIDLNYRDIVVKRNFCVAFVREGKTGPRPVILWRSVPYLIRWLQNHALKEKNSPLWLQENNSNGAIKKYKYAAVQDRLRTIGRKAGIDKPLDFYNLRHSACVIAKKDNIPEEEAAKKFGHSIKYYTETYGRLTAEDSIERFSKAYGLEQVEKRLDKTLKCQRCEQVNLPNSEVCSKCGNFLSPEKAFRESMKYNSQQSELNELKNQLEKINSVMNKLIEKNPDLLDRMAKSYVSERN